MNRRVEIIPIEEGFIVKSFCKYAPEAAACQNANLAVPPAAAFAPSPSPFAAGPPQDPPEVVTPLAPVEGYNAPPPCDGDARYGLEGAQSGQALAQAQHEAAEGEGDCTGAACLITRGSD